ncbi:MAG TPA: hypothetical protein VEK79_08765 [Thermoanaerobaculia bacterium]|nr:hypothetical protein [Thermoanaerobaculia bacterium]
MDEYLGTSGTSELLRGERAHTPPPRYSEALRGTPRYSWRVAAALFVLALGSYAYTFAGGGWNQNATFALVRSIVEERTLAIDKFAFTTGDVSFAGGHVYPNKPPGTALLAVPVYAVLVAVERAAGVDIDAFKVTTFNAYVCTVFVCGILGALIPALLFLYGRMRGIANARWLIAVSIVIAFGTPLFGYATALFVHVPSASLLFLAFVLATAGRTTTAGFAAGLATAINYLCGPPALLLGLLLARRNIIRYAIGSIVPLAVLGVYQWLAFGSFLSTSIEHMNPQFVSQGAAFGVFSVPTVEALWGVTFSHFRGLFFSAPVLLLAFAGVPSMWRRARPELLFILATTIFFLFINASFNGWHGGASFSARYLVPIIPFLGVMLLWSAAAKLPLSNAAAAAAATLAIISIALQTLFVVVDIHAPDHIRSPITEFLVPQFISGGEAGHVATNDRSTTTCRCGSAWSSFNVAEKLFGQGSRLSILPLIAWMIAGSFFLFRYHRRMERG